MSRSYQTPSKGSYAQTPSKGSHVKSAAQARSGNVVSTKKKASAKKETHDEPVVLKASAEVVEDEVMEEIDLPGYTGDLLDFPRHGLRCAGVKGSDTETQYQKDLYRLYHQAQGGVEEYREACTFRMCGLSAMLEDNVHISRSASYWEPKDEEETNGKKRESTLNSSGLLGSKKRDSTLNASAANAALSNEVNSWSLLKKLAQKGKDTKTSLALYQLAHAVNDASEKDFQNELYKSSLKQELPFLLAGFCDKNNLKDTTSITVFEKKALTAELLLLAWEMKTLEAENRDESKKQSKFVNNAYLLGNSVKGAKDMASFMRKKEFSIQNAYDRSTAFPKENGAYQYNNLLENNGDLNAAESDPATRDSSLGKAIGKRPSEGQVMDGQSILAKVKNGGHADIVRAHGYGKSVFVRMLEAGLPSAELESLNLEALQREYDVNKTQPFTSPERFRNSPVRHSRTPIKANTPPRKIDSQNAEASPEEHKFHFFKVDLHSSVEDIENITRFLEFQAEIKGWRKEMLRRIEKASDVLGHNDQEKLAHLKQIADAKIIILADEWYYYDKKQLREAEGKNLSEIEEIKYNLIGEWSGYGAVVTTLGASASLGKLALECEILTEKIAKEQKNSDDKNNKKIKKQVKLALCGYKGRDEEKGPIFHHVMNSSAEVVSTARTPSQSSAVKKVKSGVEWADLAKNHSDRVVDNNIKIKGKKITNAEYLINIAWHIKEGGAITSNVKDKAAFEAVIKALTPKCIEAQNKKNSTNPQYYWGSEQYNPVSPDIDDALKGLDNLAELMSINKQKKKKSDKSKRGNFAIGYEDLYRAVNAFLETDLWAKITGDAPDKGPKHNIKTPVAELKDELALKRDQFDSLQERLDGAMDRFTNFGFALAKNHRKDGTDVSLSESMLPYLPAMQPGEKMLYLQLHRDLNRDSYDDNDVKNILEQTGAQVLVLSDKNVSDKEMRCRVAFFEEGKEELSYVECKETQINETLHTISNRYFDGIDIAMAGIITSHNSIGGDLGDVARKPKNVFLHASNDDYVTGSESVRPVAIQLLEQNERRNRTRLDAIAENSLKTTLIISDNTQGIDFSQIVLDGTIPQVFIDKVIENSCDEDKMLREAYESYLGRNVVIEEQKPSPVQQSADSVDGAETKQSEDDNLYPRSLFADVANDTIDTIAQAHRQEDTEYEESEDGKADDEVEEDNEYEASEDGKVGDEHDAETEGCFDFDGDEYDEEWEKIMKNQRNKTSDADAALATVYYRRHSNMYQGMEAEQDVRKDALDHSSSLEEKSGEASPTPGTKNIIKTRARSLSLSGKNMFVFDTFKLQNEHPILYNNNEKISYCKVAYQDGLDEVMTAITKIILLSAQKCHMTNDDTMDALKIITGRMGIGDSAASWVPLDQLNLVSLELSPEKEALYETFLLETQELCKQCGIYAPALNDDGDDLCGFSLAVMPEKIFMFLDETLISDINTLIEKYQDCDLEAKKKQVKEEVYGARTKSFGGRYG